MRKSQTQIHKPAQNPKIERGKQLAGSAHLRLEPIFVGYLDFSLRLSLISLSNSTVFFPQIPTLPRPDTLDPECTAPSPARRQERNRTLINVKGGKNLMLPYVNVGNFLTVNVGNSKFTLAGCSSNGTCLKMTSHLSRLAAQAATARLVRVVRLQGRGAYVLARHGALIIRIRGASAVLSSSLSAVPSATRLGRCHGHADEAVAPLVGMQVDLAVQRPEQRGIVEDRRAEGPLYHARSVPHNGREQLTWRWCVFVEDGAQRSLPGK